MKSQTEKRATLFPLFETFKTPFINSPETEACPVAANRRVTLPSSTKEMLKSNVNGCTHTVFCEAGCLSQSTNLTEKAIGDFNQFLSAISYQIISVIWVLARPKG